MNYDKSKGKVIIAGAGPGDPELITVKAAMYLEKADIILTDRLVSPEILERYTSASSKIIHVGKQCRKGITTPQSTINELMISYAKEGNLVVRLKGGDVSVFSNLLDELEALTANDVPYEIIPGVTAGIGAAAYAGIPLTARGYSTAVRFLTYYKSDIVTDQYWKELANTDDTLIFYMSSETLSQVVTKLVENNISPDKLMAVIQQATTPMQQVLISSLYDYGENENHNYVSPTLIIIGKVVGLSQQFSWIKNSGVKDYYFQPLTNSDKSGKEALNHIKENIKQGLPLTIENKSTQRHATRA